MQSAPFLRLADEFFVLAHDDYSGKALINKDVLGLGLAGALLCQLLAEQRISLSDEGVYLQDARRYQQPGPNNVVAEIHRRAGQGEVYPPLEWVKYLRDHVAAWIGDDLVRRQLMREESAGMRKGKRYVGANILIASSPRVRLAYLCDHPDHMGSRPDEQTAGLAGLAIATKLESAMASMTGVDLGPGLRWMAGQLPTDARTVVAAVDAAVISNALSVRGR